MKLSCLILLAFAVLANGYTTYTDFAEVDHKDLAHKQHFVLEIFRHVYQPLQITEYFVDGTTFVEGEMYYTNYKKVSDFFHMYHSKMLPRGEIFSIMNKRHLKEVRGLFNLFYFSKDWVTLRKNIIWARMHVNEGMFVYALTACIIHRDDMVGVMLPSPYEINPFKYFNSEVITEGFQYKLANKYTDDTTHIIYRNITEHHHDYYMMNKDHKLSYFTNDVGLNAFYYYFQLDYGFWLGDDRDYGMDNVHRGAKYLYTHQQLLARYYMERLSNGLGEIYEFDWRRPFATGYFSNLRYHNGLVYPMRHNNYVVHSHTKRDILIEKVMDYERRLRDIIDRGYIFVDNKRIDIRDPKSVDVLGKMIMGNTNSVEGKFYRYVEVFARILLSGSFYTKNDYKIVPGVLEHFETSLRDPAFYMLYKRIVRFYFDFKKNLKSYTTNDLFFNGVKVDNVHVDKLFTYFEHYDTDITNVIDIKHFDKMEHMDTYDYNRNTVKDTTWKWLIKARQLRLNHEAFTVNMDITSDKIQKVVVRSFFAPKYDEFGEYITFNENRENMLEVDKFVYDLKVGHNTIRRSSKDFYYTIPDSSTYMELYKHVMGTTVNTEFTVHHQPRYCAFPDRLILPKGKVGGLHMHWFVIVTPFTGTVDKIHDKVFCGKHSTKYFDELPYGYPFDRKIENHNTFMVDNMFMTDFTVFHKDDYDMHKNYVV